MLSKKKVELIVSVVAVLTGIIAVAIFYFSGQGDFELQKRQLENADSSVEKIYLETKEQGQKELQIKCKDGTSYDIYLPPGETNYDALAASKC